MILSDCLTVVISIMSLFVLYLDKKIPKRCGGHIVDPGNLIDHLPRFKKDGTPAPGKWHVRQARIGGLRRFLLWTMAVIGMAIFVFRKFRW
jgi:hypothetical protein